MNTVDKIHPLLPIFALRDADYAVVYTPGAASVVNGAYVEALMRSFHSGDEKAWRDEPAARFEEQARRAQQRWHQLQHASYEPECLTVYLSNVCNLGCRYCFADDATRFNAKSAASPVVDDEAVRQSARLVARHCREKDKAFTLVVHGGGEPTLHWSRLMAVVENTRRIAADFDLPWWGYIATHGVIPEEKARWLAAGFNQIGLSCDGPPSIQNRQRPTRKQHNTSGIVERTASVFKQAGTPFSVRATITPATMTEQQAIVDYVFHRLGCSDIRFEPVYGDHACGRFQPDDAERFAGYFLKARQFARQLGADLHLSGVRHHEFHGPYCNSQRQVLQLTPGGAYSNCFLNHDGAQSALNLGDVSRPPVPASNTITAMQSTLSRLPSQCQSCANVYHCSRDCPDVCMLTAPAGQWAGGFRCRLNKFLTHAWFHELIDTVRGNAAASDGVTDKGVEQDEIQNKSFQR